MARVALGISYDGRPWQGWQTQPSRQTVQDTLEHAIAGFLTVPVHTICAGRTDTGVHALGQVVHLDTAIDRSEESWVRGVNAYLPDTVCVQWARIVDENFHARFSATSRAYTYVILNTRVRQPLWAGRAGWIFQPLNLAVMQQAAQQLIGEHDFSSFRSSQCQAKSPVRTMTAITITQQQQQIYISLRANAFLHHMVRNIVGALVQIGHGREGVDYLDHLLKVRDRTQGAPTFSPDGLYLSDVTYPGIDLPKGVTGSFGLNLPAV